MDSILISDWLLGLGWLLVGGLIGIFCVNPFLSILLFDLPLALTYLRKGYFQEKTPFVVYALGLAFFAALGLLVLPAVLAYAQRFLAACVTGLLICMAIALLDLVFNPRNRLDFIQDNQSYLSPLGVRHLVEQGWQADMQPDKKKVTSERRNTSGLTLLLKRYLAFRIKLGSWLIVVE